MIESATNTFRKTFEYALPPLTLSLTTVALYQISLQSRPVEEKVQLCSGIAFLGTLALLTNKSILEIFQRTFEEKITPFFFPPNREPVDAIAKKLLQTASNRVKNNPALTEFYELLKSLKTQQKAINNKRSFYYNQEKHYDIDDEAIAKRSNTIGRMTKQLQHFEHLALQTLEKLDPRFLTFEEKKMLSALASKRQVYEQNHEILRSDKIALALETQAERARNQLGNEEDRTFSYKNCPSLFISNRATDFFDYTVTPIGKNIAICEAKGRRSRMEDATLVVQLRIDAQDKSYDLPLFGVFDGHPGISGEDDAIKASDYIKKMLPGKLKQKIEYFLTEFQITSLTDEVLCNALRQSLVELHEEYPGVHGTTVNIGLMANNAIYAANIGDSRSIFASKNRNVQLTEDAKANDPRHKKIINALGAEVLFKGAAWRTNGMISMGSALGNPYINGVNPTVDITKTVIPSEGGIYLAACDGLWDTISSKNACNMLLKHQESSPADLVKDMLYSAWEAGSEDNLSAIVVKIPRTVTL